MEDEIAPILDAGSDAVRKPSPRRKSKSTTMRWQERLLPTMVGLLIGLTLFFFAATFIQMGYLHWSILQYPPPDIKSAFSEDLVNSATNFDDKLEIRRLEITAGMESYLIDRRYHQASVLLMSGLWIRYLGFITGMILSLVGASFVLGKIRESPTEVIGKTSGIDISMKSASPGIILVILGVILMFATITDRDKFEVDDAPAYLINNTNLTGLDMREPILSPTLTIPEELLLPEGNPTSEPP